MRASGHREDHPRTSDATGRARARCRLAGIPFRIPEREELPGRIGAVLDAVYAAFAEGWDRLAQYQPHWAARAELLARTGAAGDAHRAYDIAIGLERDPAVRRFLQSRQAALKKIV